MGNNISPSGKTSATYHWIKISVNDIKTKGNNISLKQQKNIICNNVSQMAITSAKSLYVNVME